MKKAINLFYIVPVLFTNMHAQSVLDKYGDRIELLGIPFRGPMELCQILIAIFLFIAFFQSGLDKIIDKKGNLEFLKMHFSENWHCIRRHRPIEIHIFEKTHPRGLAFI